jgi:hypothetical protein
MDDETTYLNPGRGSKQHSPRRPPKACLVSIKLDSELEGTQFVEQGAVAPVRDRTRSDSHLQLNLILVHGKALDKRLQDRLSARQCPNDRRREQEPISWPRTRLTKPAKTAEEARLEDAREGAVAPMGPVPQRMPMGRGPRRLRQGWRRVELFQPQPGWASPN